MEYLGHGGTADISTLRSDARGVEVAAGMLGVTDIYVRDDVNDATVGLFGEAFVKASVACLHVEDGDVEALCADDRQTRVGVAKHEYGIGFSLDHQFIAGGNDVAHGLSKVFSHGIHVDFRVSELKILEEHAIEVVVIILSGMGENYVEILSALIYYCSQADNLRACAYYYEQFKSAVVLELSHYFIGSK